MNENDEKTLGTSQPEEVVDTFTPETEAPETPVDTTKEADIKPTNPTEAEAAGFSEKELLEVESMEVEGAPQPEDQLAGNPAQKASSPFGPPPKKSTKRKKLLLAAGLVLLVGAGAAAFFIMQPDTPVPEQATTTPTIQPEQEQKKVTLAVATVEGAVSYRLAEGDWQPLTVGTKLAEGASVRTDTTGRATLVFDNESTLRLDNSSGIKIESLLANDIKIQQLEGTAYSRIVPSENHYTVLVDAVPYVALGTAFATTNTVETKGVKVFESTVKSNETSIQEGKQYFTESTEASLKGAVTDIDVATLSDDTFIAWNATEDAKNPLFKEKLGVLAKIGQKSEETKKTETTKEKKTDQSTKKEEPKKTQTSQSTSIKLTATMGDKSTSLRWSVSGTAATKGFKVVRSTSSSTPTFNKDEAAYVEDSSAQSYTWKTTETSWYRVCVYHEDGTCTNYSNAVKVSAPKNTGIAS